MLYLGFRVHLCEQHYNKHVLFRTQTAPPAAAPVASTQMEEYFRLIQRMHISLK